MKNVGIEQATLDVCVEESRHQRIIITRDGRPVALLVGVEGMDEEQIALGSSDEFWKLIAERRGQESVSRAELERSFPGE